MVSTRSRTYPPRDSAAAESSRTPTAEPSAQTTKNASGPSRTIPEPAPRRSARRPSASASRESAPVQTTKRPRTRSPLREEADSSAPPARKRAPRRSQVFPFDESDSPPPSPSAPSGSALPLSVQAEMNQKVKRLEAKIKVLEREARYHEEQSKRWEKLSTHLLAEREESGTSQKLRRRGDTYKKAYLDEKAELHRREQFTTYCVTCLEMLEKTHKDLGLEGIIRVLKMSLPYDEAE